MKDVQEDFEKQAAEAASAYVDAPEKEVTVADLDNLVEAIAKKRAEIEASEVVTSLLNKDLATMKARGVRYLKALGRDDFKSPNGSIAINQKWRVGLPATDEDKAKLFAWMREQGIFEAYATVNSNSLNSLYKQEWEAATKRGEGMEFSMPGIGPSKLFEDLGFRKS